MNKIKGVENKTRVYCDLEDFIAGSKYDMCQKGISGVKLPQGFYSGFSFTLVCITDSYHKFEVTYKGYPEKAVVCVPIDDDKDEFLFEDEDGEKLTAWELPFVNGFLWRVFHAPGLDYPIDGI